MEYLLLYISTHVLCLSEIFNDYFFSSQGDTEDKHVFKSQEAIETLNFNYRAVVSISLNGISCYRVL